MNGERSDKLGAERLIDALEVEGVTTLFGYPGGAIMPVYDALVGSSLRHVLVRHEQAAVFAADGFARASGEVGVCLATSGPGATNLVTGIANAHLDSIPLVAITGQVPTTEMGTDAFQEVDVLGITMPIVKHSFLIRDAADIERVVGDAFHIAREGRPGPVVIDLPKDVASAVTHEPGATGEKAAASPPAIVDFEQVERARGLIEASERPLIYAGGGIALARAVPAFRAWVEVLDVPVVATLKGVGAVSTRDERYLGMLGMHGSKAANLAVQTADLLVCVGARFDDRATGRLSAFAPHARVIHMDVDPREVGKRRHADAAVIADLQVGLGAIGEGAKRLRIDAWRRTCAEQRVRHAVRYGPPGPRIHGPSLLRELSERLGEQAFVACDVGQHQMWVAQHGHFARPEQHLSSSGLGAMGFGIPAAIGAQFAHPDALVVTVSGDGSILMNIQELATIRRYGLPIKILLFDNSALGLVRQWQDLFYEGRRSQVELWDNPDFVAVAEAFGIPGVRAKTHAEARRALDRVFHDPGPLLVHLQIDPGENVWPLVPPGQGNDNMLERMR